MFVIHHFRNEILGWRLYNEWMRSEDLCPVKKGGLVVGVWQRLPFFQLQTLYFLYADHLLQKPRVGIFRGIFNPDPWIRVRYPSSRPLLSSAEVPGCPVTETFQIGVIWSGCKMCFTPHCIPILKPMLTRTIHVFYQSSSQAPFHLDLPAPSWARRS